MATEDREPSSRWQLAGQRVLSHAFGDELAVFDEASAATHLLGADSGAILSTLQRAGGELDAMQIWQLTFDGEPSSQEHQALIESLASLVQAGLLVAVET